MELPLPEVMVLLSVGAIEVPKFVYKFIVPLVRETPRQLLLAAKAKACIPLILIPEWVTGEPLQASERIYIKLLALS